MPTRKKYQCRRITMLFQKAYFIQLIWHPNNWPFWFRLVVRCPLCENSVKYLKLNEHIDNGCKVPSSSDAVKTWSKIMTGSKKEKHKYVNMSPYLFYLYFHVGGKKTVIVTENIRFQSKLMPPSKIGKSRKCFSNMIYQWTEIGQSGNNDTSGIASHHALDFRFLFFCSSWVMLYNSNLDRSLVNRKSKVELRKDLKKWENDMSKNQRIIIRDVVDYQVWYELRVPLSWHVSLIWGNRFSKNMNLPSW